MPDKEEAQDLIEQIASHNEDYVNEGVVIESEYKPDPKTGKINKYKWMAIGIGIFVPYALWAVVLYCFLNVRLRIFIIEMLLYVMRSIK